MHKVGSGIMADENVSKETNGTPVPCGIAQSVLVVREMVPSGEIPGQIFRVRDPAADKWLYPPVFSIDVARAITEKDLVRSAEDVAEKLICAVRDREDEILLYLLEQAKSFQSVTTDVMSWSSLSPLLERAQQAVVNFDFMSSMDEETMQRFEPVTQLELAKRGCVGYLELNERTVLVWQRIVPDAAHWIAACPSPVDMGAIALYNTEIEMRSDHTVHQKCERCMVVFGANIQFLGVP